MGFSVSGATAIIFLAMFVSFGIAYSAAYNGFERVTDAESDHDDRMLDRRNTALDITATNYSDGNLTVAVNNTGSTALDVTDTDVLVDGSYVTAANLTADVNGDTETDLWLPGETLHLDISVQPKPTRVKVVTETGVAATEVV